MRYNTPRLIFAKLLSLPIILSACKPERIESSYAFPARLSSLELYAGDLKSLNPGNGVVQIELASTLFTDYAEKQRLVKVPSGKQITAIGGGLPKFPEGTILAKTFYYRDSRLPLSEHRILETRILLYRSSKWSAATYQWNAGQTDALLTTDGATVKQEIITQGGVRKSINYAIPSLRDCVACHRAGDSLMPIGPKIRNLDISLLLNGHAVSQLSELEAAGLLKRRKPSGALPAYANTNLSIEKRARAYLDINCAHCHNPAGYAGQYGLDLQYTTAFPDTGIEAHKIDMLQRMKEAGSLHMPKIGTSINHKEGIDIIESYVEYLNNH